MEGKDEMPMVVVRAFSFEFLTKFVDNWAQLYLLLLWNLSARCDNVATIKLSHIASEQDYITFSFPVTKTDQGLVNLYYGWLCI